ncbi:hypothetical protein HN51_047037, partial [Arachis hypogaea]
MLENAVAVTGGCSYRSKSHMRKVNDEIHGYSLTSMNPFVDDSSPKDHAFVDEFSYIESMKLFHVCNYASNPSTGCKNCTNVAPDVFAIEKDFGRVRYFSPVDCIHWTSAAQLSLLEDEMRRIERVNSGDAKINFMWSLMLPMQL